MGKYKEANFSSSGFKDFEKGKEQRRASETTIKHQV